MLAVLTDHDKASIDALNSALSAWVTSYNTTEHSSLGRGKTPMDSYRSGLEHVREATDTKWVEECFFNRTSRKVKNDSTISIDKVDYDVPMSFIGTRVDVRYLPDDMTSAHIIYEDKTYPITPTDKVANSKIPRQLGRYQLDYASVKGGEDDV